MPDFINPHSRRRVARVTSAEVPGVRGLTMLAVSVTVVAALYFGRQVLIPITLAVLLSFLAAPLVNFLRRIKLGKVTSVLVSVILSITVIVLMGGVIVTQITDLAKGLPHFQHTIERKVETVQELTIGKLGRLAGTAGRALQQATVAPPPRRGSEAAVEAARTPAAMPVEVREAPLTPFQLAQRVLTPVVSPLETTFIVFIVTIFILLQRDDLRDRAIRLLGSGDLHRTTTAMDDAARRLSRYFVSQLSVNAGVGVVIGVGLYFIGVPSPLLWGILAALLRFVPYVGSWVAALLATALAAAVSPAWAMALGALALFVTVELLVSQVVEPMLYGHSTGLSPFAVVVAAIFWSWIWGPIGLILSTPLTLCLVVLGRHVEPLEFLDVLLGDRPALTPVENFYQRALSGDPDEALAQAETLLHEHSLSSYYDEVALKGLQLAASDVLRGVVTPLQLARIKTTTEDLIEGLDGFDDVEPVRKRPEEDRDPVGPLPDEENLPHEAVPHGPPQPTSPAWRAQHPVLCIAGRGPLDELASAILVQLLDKHGLDCRIIPHEAASRSRIGHLDAGAATTVCIFYLDIIGIPSSLRYLLRRVRQRLPQASIIVGLWPQGDTDQWSEDLQSAIGADYYASSARDMVNACLAPPQPLQSRSRDVELGMAVGQS